MSKTISRMDQAICRIVTTLNGLLYGVAPDWKPIIHGFEVKIEDRSQGRVCVTIHPAGWGRDSYIGCSILNTGEVRSASILVNHLRSSADEPLRISFDFLDPHGGPLYLRGLQVVGSWSIEISGKIRARMVQSA